MNRFILYAGRGNGKSFMAFKRALKYSELMKMPVAFISRRNIKEKNNEKYINNIDYSKCIANYSKLERQNLLPWSFGNRQLRRDITVVDAIHRPYARYRKKDFRDI